MKYTKKQTKCAVIYDTDMHVLGQTTLPPNFLRIQTSIVQYKQNYKNTMRIK